MSEYFVVYSQRQEEHVSNTFNSLDKVFEWVDELENSIGGFAEGIFENDKLLYDRIVIDENVYWKSEENGLTFE